MPKKSVGPRGRRAPSAALLRLSRRPDCGVAPHDLVSRWGPPNALPLRNSPDVVKQLTRVVEKAQDERPIHCFLDRHPCAAVYGAYGKTPMGWVFSKPRLGGGSRIPDFLICDYNSVGPGWIILELESPTISPLTTTGLVSAGLRTAVDQILEYRSWVRLNAGHEHLQGWVGLDEHFPAVIVIGRRDRAWSDTERRRIRDFERGHSIEVMSYDRFLNNVAICHAQAVQNWSPPTTVPDLQLRQERRSPESRASTRKR